MESPQPNTTAGEMLRRLRDEIISNPDPELTEEASEVFKHILIQITALRNDFDGSSDDVHLVLKHIKQQPK